jgi:hypothetical protein
MLHIDQRCLDFIGSKTQELLQHGVTVYLSNKSSVNGMYGGTFCGRTMKLSVAMNNGIRSFYDFVHEYSHFLQCRDRLSFWNAHIDHVNTYLNWVSNPNLDLSARQVNRAVKGTIALEHDCELTAVTLLRTFNLPVDIAAYCRQANANMLYYQWGKKHRRWGANGPAISEEEFALHLPSFIPDLPFFLNKSNYTKYIKLLDNK